MLKAHSIIKNLDKKACEIIIKAGIHLDISNSDKRPNKEGLIKLLVDCIKLFLVNLILSLSEVSTFDKSVGLKSSPVESM